MNHYPFLTPEELHSIALAARDSHKGANGASMLDVAVKAVYDTHEACKAKVAITDREEAVIRGLVEAWDNFIRLPSQHQDEQDEMRRAIHAAQAVIAVRVARRATPGTFIG